MGVSKRLRGGGGGRKEERAFNTPRNSLACIAVTLDLGNIRRRNFPLVQLVPVHFGKPAVAKDVGRTATQVSVPFREIACEQVLQELFGKAIKVSWVADFALCVWPWRQTRKRRGPLTCYSPL